MTHNVLQYSMEYFKRYTRITHGILRKIHTDTHGETEDTHGYTRIDTDTHGKIDTAKRK